ncbi:MAG: hypothetical protein WC955_01620 [Elusimicrobiota bacterium]
MKNKVLVVALLAAIIFVPAVHSKGPLAIQDFHVGLKGLNVGGPNSYEQINNSSIGLYGHCSGSLVDMLLSMILGDKFPVRLGDYFGTYGTMSGAMYKTDGHFPLFMNLGLLYGGFASVSLASNIDIGVKAYNDLRLDLYDYEHMTTYTGFITALMVRLNELYTEIGIGFTEAKFTMFNINARYMMSGSNFLGVRIERSIQTFSTIREDVHTGITLEFGTSY